MLIQLRPLRPLRPRALQVDSGKRRRTTKNNSDIRASLSACLGLMMAAISAPIKSALPSVKPGVVEGWQSDCLLSC
ncbi:uncharacterized protein BO66DRAFT_390981 [Aspergillus aculeatinus CBS 121060]|uniref:Uncharacterized protein n=1 Tax=Aspergillus aculeatinus CBS 121060 TaxID=1448322 RepID=A0ACD1HDG0_9EURO|nr:hypothetical protein BO66DRAFT_390981 [Aspergillus aculeatinus CBS 121060]RAH71438.1 hypothetical protein BO66DRAFT_390981 [Aspergillus aculeatinus CBS 121060]